MEKYIFCLEDNLKNITRQQFKDFIINTLIPSIMKRKPDNCKLTISALEQPTVTILPLKRNAFAMISLTGVDPAAILKELKLHQNADRSIYGYEVHESPYLLSERTWDYGMETPGLILLTMFQQKQGLERKKFMQIWFGEHSPMSIIVHPLKNYIRNVVIGHETGNAPKIDAIVEEHFGEDRYLLNPVRMFGGIKKFLPAMLAVQRHVSTFINMSNIRNYICKEYLFKGEVAAHNREMRDDNIQR
jgi:hypothetical protein